MLENENHQELNESGNSRPMTGGMPNGFGEHQNWAEQSSQQTGSKRHEATIHLNPKPLLGDKKRRNEENRMDQKVTHLPTVESAEATGAEEKNRQLSQRLEEQEEQIRQLTRSLEEAQQQNESKDQSLYEMINTNDQLKQIYEEKQSELTAVKTQLADPQQAAKQDTTLQEQLAEQKRLKEEITQVLVQVRRDAKETEDKANIEAQSLINNAKIKSREVLVEAAKELEEIKKNLQIYQGQLDEVKAESNQLFDSLKEKAQRLIDTTIEK